MFASTVRGGTEDKVQAYMMQIKDAIDEIQNESDTIEKNIEAYRMPNQNFTTCLKASSEILNLRCYKVVQDFK